MMPELNMVDRDSYSIHKSFQITKYDDMTWGGGNITIISVCHNGWAKAKEGKVLFRFPNQP